MCLIKYLAYLEESSRPFTAPGLRKFCMYPSFDQNYSTAHPSGVLTFWLILKHWKMYWDGPTNLFLTANYRLRLLDLQLRPLMMVFRMTYYSFIKSLREPSYHFDITRLICYVCSGQTRPASHIKLKHVLVATNKSTRNFYFNHLHRFGNLSLLLTWVNQ